MPRTVTITATQKFLHGDGRYAKGKTYDVSPELAAYFVFHGWATAEGVEPNPNPPETHDLSVQSPRNGHRSKIKG